MRPGEEVDRLARDLLEQARFYGVPWRTGLSLDGITTRLVVSSKEQPVVDDAIALRIAMLVKPEIFGLLFQAKTSYFLASTAKQTIENLMRDPSAIENGPNVLAMFGAAVQPKLVIRVRIEPRIEREPAIAASIH